MPKSVRFAGVAIITVYGTELISRATGTSSGSCQVTGVRLPLASMETPSAGTEQSAALGSAAPAGLAMAVIGQSSKTQRKGHGARTHSTETLARPPLLRRDQRLVADTLVLALALFPLVLPFGGLVGRRHLNRRHLVLGAVGRPVRVLGGDDVGAADREVERRVDDARRHAVGDLDAHRCSADAARQRGHGAILDATHLGVGGMHLEDVLLVPDDVLGAPRLGADVVLAEDAAGGEDEREVAVRPLRRCHELREHEPALAARELLGVHDRGAFRRLVVARPLHAAQLIEPLERDVLEGRRDVGDLVHDRGSRRVHHRIAHGGGEAADDLPLAHALLLGHHRTHAVHAALGIGEGAVLLEERGAGEEDVREGRRLVEEQVLHHEDVERIRARARRGWCWDRTGRCPRRARTGP